MLRKERNLSSFRKAFLFWGKERESFTFYLSWKGKGKERWFSKGIEQFLFRRGPRSFTAVVKYFNLLKDRKCIKPGFQKTDTKFYRKQQHFSPWKWRILNLLKILFIINPWYKSIISKMTKWIHSWFKSFYFCLC